MGVKVYTKLDLLELTAKRLEAQQKTADAVEVAGKSIVDGRHKHPKMMDLHAAIQEWILIEAVYWKVQKAKPSRVE